jgi:hypothetical protein
MLYQHQQQIIISLNEIWKKPQQAQSDAPTVQQLDPA